jgi:hypothetical protein
MYTASDLTSVEQAILAIAAGTRVTNVILRGQSIAYEWVKIGELITLRDQIKQELADVDKSSRMSKVMTQKGY